MDDNCNSHETMMVCDKLFGEILTYIDMFGRFDDVAFASVQGAANFTPAMLPKLWHEDHCGYRTPIYREAYYRGFYSAACWFLLDRLALMAVATPDLRSVFEWYVQEHPHKDWVRVPGHRYLTEASNG